MDKTQEYEDIIKTINIMKLSDEFYERFNTLIYYLKNYDKFRCWELVDALYPMVKLEENINDEQVEYIKQSLLKIGKECK